MISYNHVMEVNLHEAKTEAAVAADLDAGKNPEVAQTLTGLHAKKE